MQPLPSEVKNRDRLTGTLIRLRGLYPSLKTALQKVGDVILKQPEMAIYASVNEVAAAAGVSEATVMRFCRTLGFRGFQDFKIALAREMVIPSPREPEKMPMEGDPGTDIRMVFQASVNSLQETLEVLETRSLEEAAQLLAKAPQIMVIGVDGLGPVVEYACNRFLLLNLPAHGYTDFYLMIIAAALLGPEDTLLAVSNSGTSRELVETARVARENEARVIAITNNSLSSLARSADLVLATASREMRLPEESTASLVCQITMVDALLQRIFKMKPSVYRENLEKMEKVLARTGVLREPLK